MHRPPDPVTNELANDAEPVALHVVLYRARNLNYSLTRNCLGNALIKGLFGHIHQLLGQDSAAADRDGSGGVPYEPIMNYADIEAYDITKLKISRSG